jgi:hypothetical protein
VQERLEVDDCCGADHVATKALSHDSSSELEPGGSAVEEPVAVASCDPVVEPGDERVEQGADDVSTLRGLEVQVVGDVLHLGWSGRIAHLSEGLDYCLAHGRGHILAEALVPRGVGYDTAGYVWRKPGTHELEGALHFVAGVGVDHRGSEPLGVGAGAGDEDHAERVGTLPGHGWHQSVDGEDLVAVAKGALRDLGVVGVDADDVLLRGPRV